jgi:hypothetical protein
MNWEVARFRDAESAGDLAKALTESGIPSTVSSTAPAFDISSVGRGAVGEYLVLVQGEDNEMRARESMLEGDRVVLQAGLSPDSYLREFDSADLHDILQHPREWSTYDVASAEMLLKERGEAFESAKYERLTDTSVEVVEKKKLQQYGQFILIAIICVGVVKVALAILKQAP